MFTGGFHSVYSFVLDRIGLCGRQGTSLSNLWRAVDEDERFHGWASLSTFKSRIWNSLLQEPRVLLKESGIDLPLELARTLTVEDACRRDTLRVIGIAPLRWQCLGIPDETFLMDNCEVFAVLEIVGTGGRQGKLMTEIKDELSKLIASTREESDDEGNDDQKRRKKKKKKASTDVNYLVGVLQELGLVHKELQANVNRVWLTRFLKEGEEAIALTGGTEGLVSNEPESPISWAQRQVEAIMQRIKRANGQTIVAYMDVLELIHFREKKEKQQDFPKAHTLRVSLASRYDSGTSLVELKQFHIPRLERGAREQDLEVLADGGESSDSDKPPRKIDKSKGKAHEKDDAEPDSSEERTEARPFSLTWCCILHEKPLSNPRRRQKNEDAKVQALEESIQSTVGQKELGSLLELSYIENIRLLTYACGKGGILVQDLSSILQTSHKTLSRVVMQFEKPNEGNRLGVVRTKFSGKYNDKYGIVVTEEAQKNFLSSEAWRQCLTRIDALGLMARQPDEVNGPTNADDKRVVRQQVIEEALAERGVERLAVVQKMIVDREQRLDFDGEVDHRSIKTLVSEMKDVELGYWKDPTDERFVTAYLIKPSANLSSEDILSVLTKRSVYRASESESQYETKTIVRIPNMQFLIGIEKGILKPTPVTEREGLQPRAGRKRPRTEKEQAAVNQMRRDRRRQRAVAPEIAESTAQGEINNQTTKATQPPPMQIPNLKLYSEGYSSGQGLDILHQKTLMRRTHSYLKYLLDYIKDKDLEPNADGCIPIDLRDVFRNMPALTFVQVFKRNKNVFSDWNEDTSGLILEAINQSEVVSAAVPDHWFEKKDQPKEPIDMLRSLGILRARFVQSQADPQVQMLVNDFVTEMQAIDGEPFEFSFLQPEQDTSAILIAFFRKLYNLAARLAATADQATLAQAWYRPKSWGPLKYSSDPPTTFFSLEFTNSHVSPSNRTQSASKKTNTVASSKRTRRTSSVTDSGDTFSNNATPSSVKRSRESIDENREVEDESQAKTAFKRKRKRSTKVDLVTLKQEDLTLLQSYFACPDLKRGLASFSTQGFDSAKDMRLRLTQALERKFTTVTSGNKEYSPHGWALRNHILFGVIHMARLMVAEGNVPLQNKLEMMAPLKLKLEMFQVKDILKVVEEFEQAGWFGKKSVGDLKESKKSVVNILLRRLCESSLSSIRTVIADVIGPQQRPRKFRASALSFDAAIDDVLSTSSSSSVIQPVDFPIKGKDVLMHLPKVAEGKARLLVNYEPDDLEPIRQEEARSLRRAPRIPISDLAKNEAIYRVSVQFLHKSKPKQHQDHQVPGVDNEKERAELLDKISKAGDAGFKVVEETKALQGLVESGKVQVVPFYDHKRAIESGRIGMWQWVPMSEESEDDKTGEASEKTKGFVPRRWTTLNGNVDVAFRRELERSLISFVFDSPGCTKRNLVDAFYPLLDPVDVDELLAPFVSPASSSQMINASRCEDGITTFAPCLSKVDRRFLFQDPDSTT